MPDVTTVFHFEKLREVQFNCRTARGQGAGLGWRQRTRNEGPSAHGAWGGVNGIFPSDLTNTT